MTKFRFTITAVERQEGYFCYDTLVPPSTNITAYINETPDDIIMISVSDSILNDTKAIRKLLEEKKKSIDSALKEKAERDREHEIARLRARSLVGKTL